MDHTNVYIFNFLSLYTKYPWYSQKKIIGRTNKTWTASEYWIAKGWSDASEEERYAGVIVKDNIVTEIKQGTSIAIVKDSSQVTSWRYAPSDAISNYVDFGPTIQQYSKVHLYVELK